MERSLDEFLSEARNLRGQIKRNAQNRGKLQLQLMLLLVELRGQDLLWRQDFHSWDDLLRGEGMPQTAYYRFESALNLLSLDDVQRFGVLASSTIVMSAVAYRKKLISRTRSWYIKRGHPKPSHEAVSRYVWRQRRELAPKQEFVSRGQLLRYIEKLKKKLRKSGIRVPRPDK